MVLVEVMKMTQFTEIKAKVSKRFQLTTAIKHYLNGGGIYRFMSLYDDNEPFPIDEVIALQKERIGEFKAELSRCYTDFLQEEITKNERLLKRLELKAKR